MSPHDITQIATSWVYENLLLFNQATYQISCLFNLSTEGGLTLFVQDDNGGVTSLLYCLQDRVILINGKSGESILLVREYLLSGPVIFSR